MGCWGMGLPQSDEYCEIYERFMEEYDEGKPVADIANDILEEYLEEFEEDDGVLHDVYFALGKAEWMCGGILDERLNQITRIIESDANIEFYRELEATEKDLKLRKRNLEKFLAGLKVPRGKTRKRKVSPENYVPQPKPAPLPKVECGDVFAYEYKGGYRIFALTEKTRWFDSRTAYCYAWKRSFETLPDFEQLLKEKFIPLGYFRGEAFPDMENLTFIGNYPILAELNRTYPYVLNKEWKPAVNAIAKEENLIEDYPEMLCMTLEEALEKIETLRKNIYSQ